MLNINTSAKLQNGYEMPLLGFGTWQLKEGDESYNCVRYALDVGYRHIDTARFYKNEKSVGRAVRESDIPRDQVFVTTKLLLPPGSNADKMFEDSFQMLDLEYVDLLLIHFPVPLYIEKTWEKLEKIYESGKVRSLGVSNYSTKQIDKVLEICEIPPVVNQIKWSPFNYDPKMHNYLVEKNIYLEAYSPLTRGNKLDNEVLVEIAKKYNKTTAQILISWNLQNDFIVIPKSANKDRILENSQVYDFQISEDDMKRLNGLGEG